MKAATRAVLSVFAAVAISIHAAREGGDAVLGGHTNSPEVFQSTPPVKAATIVRHRIASFSQISIHAAREGGDNGIIQRIHVRINFNPRRP